MLPPTNRTIQPKWFNSTLFHVLILVILGAVIYSNTLHVPFQFDDDSNIAFAPFVKSFHHFLNHTDVSGHRLYQFFRSRIVVFFTLAINYHLHGLNVVGYHIANTSIHIINAILVYILTFSFWQTPLLKNENESENYSRTLAFAAALLFLCHPIQTQAVTYIIQRMASLACLFYLLSTVSYVKYRLLVNNSPLKRRMYYALSLLAAILAMKSKENAFTLPLCILLTEFVFFEGNWKKRLFFTIPLLLTFAIIPLDRAATLGSLAKASRLQTSMSRWQYLFTEFPVIMTYLRLLVLPIQQNLDYDFPIYNSLLQPPVMFSFLFLLVLFCTSAYFVIAPGKKKSSPAQQLSAYGILWMFIALSVESSFLPIADVIFEHRMYLPSVGLFIAIPTIIFMVLKKLFPSRSQNIFIILILIWGAILSTASYMRNTVWQSHLALWEDVAQKSPKKPRVFILLGNSYKEEGMTEKALKAYRLALALAKTPKEKADASYNVAKTYEESKNIDAAVQQYKETLRIDKSYVSALFNLGYIYKNRNDLTSAIQYYEAIIKIEPHNADAFYNLGNIYNSTGNLKNAERYWKKAVEANPLHSLSLNQLGNIKMMANNFNDAIMYYEKALMSDRNNTQSHYNIAICFERTGNPEKAIIHYSHFIDTASPDMAAIVSAVRGRITRLRTLQPRPLKGS